MRDTERSGDGRFLLSAVRWVTWLITMIYHSVLIAPQALCWRPERAGCHTSGQLPAGRGERGERGRRPAASEHRSEGGRRSPGGRQGRQSHRRAPGSRFANAGTLLWIQRSCQGQGLELVTKRESSISSVLLLAFATERYVTGKPLGATASVADDQGG